MNITTNVILDHIAFMKREKLSKEYLNNLEDIAIDIKNSEEELVSIMQPCDRSTVSMLGENYDSINIQQVSNLSANNYQSYNVQKLNSCLLNMAYISHDKYNSQVRSFIDNLAIIGEPSAFGIAMTVDFLGAPKLAVIKVPKDNNSNNNHEIVVGLYGLNELRKEIPNFAFVYGGFNCSSPIINPRNNKVLSWCSKNSNNQVMYALYENVQPSITLHEYCGSCTASDFMCQYVQLLYAIRLANIKCEFTHFDLHNKNVLVVSTPGREKLSIRYEDQYGEKYISTDRISTIIDYGQSHIYYNKKHYGFSGLEEYSIAAISNPMCDCYKILLFSMLSMGRVGNNDALELGSILLKFFNKSESIYHVLNKQLDTYYTLPIIDEVTNVTVDDYLNYIYEKVPSKYLEFLGMTPSYNVLQDKVPNYDIFGDEQQNVPTTIDSLYQLYMFYDNDTKQQEFKDIISKFNYNNAIYDALDRIIINLTKVSSGYKNILSIPIDLGTLDTPFQSDTITDMYLNYIDISSTYDDLTNLYDKVIYIKDHLDNGKYSKSIKKLGIFIKGLLKKKEAIQDKFQMIITNIKKLYNKNKYQWLLDDIDSNGIS